MAVNCIYDDGSVLVSDDPENCPMDNAGAQLVDVTELSSEIDVTTPAPVPWFTLAAIAGAALLLFRPRRKK